MVLGATWAAERQLSGRQNNGMESDEVDSGHFERLGARTEMFFEQCFTAWGTWCANNPWLVLFIGTNLYMKFQTIDNCFLQKLLN